MVFRGMVVLMFMVVSLASKTDLYMELRLNISNSITVMVKKTFPKILKQIPLSLSAYQ